LTISPLAPSSSPEKRSEILYGVDNAVGRGVYFMSNVKKRMDIYFDHRAPSIVVEIEEYRNGYKDIRKRGGKIRAFTEITNDNINYCKELIKLVDELRHLNGVKGGLAVSETEYMATTVLEEAKPLTQVIFSSVKEVVEQGQYIFDTLWNTAIPAEQKIKEIEEGILHYETRIVEDPDQIIEEISRITANSNELYTCLTPGGMQYSYNYFFKIKKKLLEKQKKGQHKGIRYITKIEKHNIDLAKTYLNYGIQIRHVKNLPPMSFGVSDKEMSATIEKMEGGKKIQSLLISTEPLYIKHFNSIFEELWNNGIDVVERIKDIESGMDLADIEVILSSARAQEIYLDIVKVASEEILWIFPTTNAFIREDRMGAIPSAIQAARERNVKVRILMPRNNLVIQKVQQLKEYCPSCQISFRYIEQMSETKATILVVDRGSSMVMELKDDTKSTFIEATGLSTYSNSKAGTLSYVAIFENLWKQSELYEQLIKAHEQLKSHDQIQKEFINIAAHELRTPIQPILGLSQILQSKMKNNNNVEYQELLDPIVRNAKRLKELTENILDVAKIESQSLQLKKELLNINEVILAFIADHRINIKKIYNNNVKIALNSKDDIFVMADRLRLYQVFANLLNNAIKFTKEGDIITIIVQRNDNNNNNNNAGANEAIVSIKDTGVGIDPNILPRLFSKFATKTEPTGTGLGLFISKGIVEAHGGRIWAENNLDAKGATLYFSLPIVNK
jgi:two-component system, OmpR family, sensor histidine kinase VicK